MRILFFLCLSMTLGQLSAVLWEEDYSTARQKALKEQKGLVILFSGSDWCHWCKKMDTEIFQDPKFDLVTKEHFVFLKVDFPHRKKLSPQQLEINGNLQRQFEVSGYPSLVVLDSKEKVIKRMGYYKDMNGEKYGQLLLKGSR